MHFWKVRDAGDVVSVSNFAQSSQTVYRDAISKDLFLHTYKI
jgi:hypothetical protein